MALNLARSKSRRSVNSCSAHRFRKLRLTFLLTVLILVTWCGAANLVAGGQESKAQLTDVPGGKAWVDPELKLRIYFTGDRAQGYDVTFQSKVGANWQSTAAFPAGTVWAVYDQWDAKQWDPKWYSGEHGFKVSRIRLDAQAAALDCRGQGEVDGQAWEFQDRYSFEHGAVKMTRRWHHVTAQSQSPISLVNIVRVPVGDDPRTLIPGVLYNDNPGAYPSRQVPHVPMVAFAKGLYEEHRTPVPFVNVESTLANLRTYASILSVPSKVPQGHRGDDQWWSLGLQWRWGDEVDLLLASGAVTTNGMNSMVYGHPNGYDPYEDAFIDVKGDTTFEKTFYIDCGIAPRTGYAFRETLWKAFDIFQPVKTSSIPFPQAMDLKFKFAVQAYYEAPDGTAGFPVIFLHPLPPPDSQRLMYGWVGRNLATAYALLCEADRTGNETYRRMGMNTIRFYVEHVRRDIPGLLYGDYAIPEKKWVGFLGLPDWPESISARQLGETLDHLAELTMYARKRRLPEADRWQALLVEAGNFLVTTKRYRGMYPKSWYPDGRPVGWERETPAPGTVTAGGAYLISPLVKLYRLTGDPRYLDTAESALRAYYEEYGQDLKHSYAGATLDAACEDREAGQAVLHGAMAVYGVTEKPEYLGWARDAADWVLTWYYMHDVQLPSSSPFHGYVNTVGWTAVSVYLDVIDMFGNSTAPDFYLLGKYLNDPRYQDIARTIYAASTQSIARPGAMFGMSFPGMQYEHINDTNFTYIRGGHWRSEGGTPRISWVIANTLYTGTKLVQLGALSW